MDTPKGLQAFYPTPNPKYEPGKPYRETEEALKHDYKTRPPSELAKKDLELRRNFYDRTGKDLATDLADKQTNGNSEDKGANGSTGGLTAKQIDGIAKDSKKPTYCTSCGIDCSLINYHYTKDIPSETKVSSIDVCAPCMAEGRYPSNTELTDYIRQEEPNFARIPEKDAPWKDSEVLRLLEALEKFDEDWNEIASHVRSRTREECVVKFLQLEIEDQYLEPEISGPTYQGLEAGRIPFSQGDNPVLSVLGFLTGLSEPSVAAAAGGRAIDEQTKRMRQRLEAGIGGEANGRGQETGGALKGEDMMEVENANSPQPNSSNQVAVAEAEDHSKDVANHIFAAAGTRAAALASNEEREMTRLVSAAVNTTLEKFELKMDQFKEMEAALQSERRELERERQQLFLDRLAFRKRVVETQEALQRATLTGGEEGTRMAQSVPVGGGESMMFQGAGGAERMSNMQPLSAGGAGSVSHEI